MTRKNDDDQAAVETAARMMEVLVSHFVQGGIAVLRSAGRLIFLMYQLCRKKES